VFSIVDDIQFDTPWEVSPVLRKLQERNDQRPCVGVFAGCKTSTNPLKCYWSNVLVMQGSNRVQGGAWEFGKPVTVQMSVRVEDCLKFRNYEGIAKGIEGYKEGDCLISGVNAKKELIRFAGPGHPGRCEGT
jgi:hypothetical protein